MRTVRARAAGSHTPPHRQSLTLSLSLSAHTPFALTLCAHTPFARTGDGIINYNEFVQVLLGSANGIPPPVKIPDDLIPYMNAIKDKKK